MQRILYIDCIFLENLVMDLFLVAQSAGSGRILPGSVSCGDSVYG